ncbi:MAG: M20/M25/M40 family metallo-hydrolase, partial [Aureliella sp.]
MNRNWRIAKRAGQFLLVSLLLLAGIMSWNCWKLSSRQLTVAPIPILKLDDKILAERLQGAIRLATISTEMSRLTKDSELHRFGDYLESQFPTLHNAPWIRRTGKDFGDELNPSLLFEWPGRKPDLDAILLMSHFDVVPIESNSLAEWTHSPFSGDIDDSFIWGRGTLDCKHGVMAIMEAVNLLVINGFQPERTIYLAFGHDEELGGAEGNKKMADWLRSHGKRLYMILDEGGCILTEFPGLARPAALVGVAEKGILNVALSVDVAADQVGHGSMPPPKTAVGILASAVHQVQNNPFPMRLDGGIRETL